MSTYLCFNIPQQGNVNPTLAIVQGLVTRGEQVTYYLTEEFRLPIEATGATFRGYISGLHFDQLAQLTINQNNANSLLTIGEQVLRECRLLLPQILDDLHGERPDGIIYGQAALWGRVLAHILHVPAIIVRPSYASNEHFQLSSILNPPVSPAVIEERTAHLARLNDQLHALCADYDIPAFDLTDLFTHAEPLTLVTLPRAFQYAGETFDARFQFVGPCILPRYNGNDFPLEQLRKQPTLYISLGTTFNQRLSFYQTCLNAFAHTPWQVVMSIGKHISLAELGTLPDNFIVHPYVPQLDVLARSSIFISHGGMNSIMEALSYGVPLIVIPQIQEQALTARRVVELDLGVALEPEQVTTASLREAVNYIAHQPEIRMRTRQMQKIIAETGGVHAAVDAILQYLHTRRIPSI